MAAHPPETRTRVLDLARAGKSRNDIARETGVAAGTISKWARESGLSFDRTAVAAATEARKVDLAARRATAQDVELQILEASQQAVLKALRGDETWKTILRGAEGIEREHEVSFVPAADMQRHANARSSSTTIIGRLTDTDAGVQAVTNLLGSLAENLGIVDGPDTTTDP